MKRIISMILCAVTLALTVSPVISGEDPGAIALDLCAPARMTEDGTVLISAPVTAAEALSYFRDKAALAAVSSDGEPLAPDDEVNGGERIVCGEESVTVYLYGDANLDGKRNSRDVVAAMKSLVGQGSVPQSVTDVNCDGAVNARDVTSMMRAHVGRSEPFGEASKYAASGDPGVSLYFDTLLHRVSREDASVYGVPAGLCFVAKNETEDAELTVVSKAQKSGVTLEISPLANAAGNVLDVAVLEEYYWESTVYKTLLSGKTFDSPTESGYFAEALPKLDGAFDLGANESKAIVFQVKTNADTAPGYYKADVTLRASDGAALKSAVLRVYVWDFELDVAPAMETALGFDPDTAVYMKAKEDARRLGTGILKLLNSPEYIEDAPRIKELYMDFFLESRISPYHLPYSVTDERVDKYLDDPRLTSFCLDTAGNGHEALKAAMAEGTWVTSDEYYINAYRKLAQKDDWLHKAYVYYVDEPSTLNTYLIKEVHDHITAVLDSTDDLKGLEWHQVAPMGGNDPYKDENGVLTDSNDYAYRYTDIMIPQSYAFTKYYSNAERIEAKKLGIVLFPPGSYVNRWTTPDIWNLWGKQWQERYDEYAAEGRRRWWYICCSPMLPHPNYFRYYQGAAQRVTFWQQYMFHVEGLLYYATQMNWQNITLKRNSNDGDGLLLYWGEMWGQEGPVPSIRWEYIRDGIEDFQYFTQLERAGVSRDEIVSKYVNRVTTEILEYSEDPYLYEATRVDIGFALEALAGD